jgi:hypothetical protein
MFVAKLNEALASKRSFIADPLNFISLGIAGLLNIIHWLILLSKIKPGQPSVLLHYNVIIGADFIGSSTYIYWIPLLALILLLINIVVSVVFYKNEKLASYFINFASIPVQLVFFAATLVLIFINA